LSDLDMTALRNVDALDLVAETVAAGAPAGPARNWWLEELSRRANDAGIDLAALAISPAQVARIIELVENGQVNNKLARVVVDGVLAGEGSPDEVVAGRNLAVVTDTSVLAAAVDEAIAANPDIAAKIADGKVAAAGALVGAVMKATKGQADAASVRELILQRCARG
jgi:aspartyl-tRNA(Asn)/glutamyl-tRNA(Gln) amidotransferase subunit B